MKVWLIAVSLFALAFVPIPWAQEMVTGPVQIYDTVYERVDPGLPFAEALRMAED